MPLLFPSHPGLVLPLWAKWPQRFDGLALCVGATVPDLVDGAAWCWRGRLGQWLGHSLVGLFLLCLPAGLLLTALLRSTRGHWRWPPWLERLDTPGPMLRQGLSVLLGAASHLLSDLVSHDGFKLLLPWHDSAEWFPAWWRHAWARVPLPVYDQPYPIAPHTVAWVVLSVVGAVWFVRAVSRTAPPAEPEDPG